MADRLGGRISQCSHANSNVDTRLSLENGRESTSNAPNRKISSERVELATSDSSRSVGTRKMPRSSANPYGHSRPGRLRSQSITGMMTVRMIFRASRHVEALMSTHGTPRRRATIAFTSSGRDEANKTGRGPAERSAVRSPYGVNSAIDFFMSVRTSFSATSSSTSTINLPEPWFSWESFDVTSPRTFQ